MYPKVILAALSAATLCATASAPAMAGLVAPDFDWRAPEFSAGASGEYGLYPTANNGSYYYNPTNGSKPSQPGTGAQSTSYDSAPGLRGEGKYIHDMSVGNVSTTVTIEAINPSITQTSSNWQQWAVMSWDANDGIGITQKGAAYYGYDDDYEDDEIEGSNERLKFSFSNPVTIDAIYVSDLFHDEAKEGYYANGAVYDEWGYFRLNGDDDLVFKFSADGTLEDSEGNITALIDNGAAANGEWIIPLPATDVSMIEFWAEGYVCEYYSQQYHKCKIWTGREFALAGVDIVQNGPPPSQDVPEPGPLALLAVGLIGLGAVRYRKMRG